MLITVQSFEAIGRRSSEILCLVKKTSRLKQKAFGTNVPGGLIKSRTVGMWKFVNNQILSYNGVFSVFPSHSRNNTHSRRCMTFHDTYVWVFKNAVTGPLKNCTQLWRVLADMVSFYRLRFNSIQFNFIVKLAWQNAANGQNIKWTTRY